jgi:3-phenylpropionate/trans-cinnamate dioxygenase ferredoxin reductase subunit
MRKTCTVTVNGKKFFAQCGDLLLDAALTSGVSLPHDCRSGVCGTCRVRVVEGRVFGGGGEDTVCACQARVISNLEIELDPVPHTMNVAGSVTRLERLAPDVIGVSIELAKPVHYLPGQYCKFAFRGFSERCYSPTYPLEGQPNERLLHLHIRTLADGQVSSALGREIRAGHRVKVIGPLGSAYFQPQHPGRTVLVASGTGFAPMWSVAVAAIFEQPRRELVFLAAARNATPIHSYLSRRRSRS